MVHEVIIGVGSAVIGSAITIAADEYRFRLRHKGALIARIVDEFLRLRKEGTHEQVYELRSLQCSGILLLKKEKEANKVLRRISLTDRPVNLPASIESQGLLKGLRAAIAKDIDLNDFRDVTIDDIGHRL